MDVELERQVEVLFQELADLPPGERDHRLRSHGGDPLVAQRVSRLLAHHDQSRDPGLRAPAFSQAALTSFMASAHPGSVGPYRILQPLGEGGMGVVYLAEQTHPIHRRVALKVIKLGMDTRAVIARFDAEREALALMDHPHVARVIDAGATEQGRPYFVMEYVEGVPLNTYCDDNRLALNARLRLFAQVCQAVQHAHQKGIIHRDLKPSNVLVAQVDGAPMVKVIDFGIAKATQQKLGDVTYTTEQGVLMGTPAYMSPEQADPACRDVDTRTDVYSLGVMLYELLVGSLPLDPGTLRAAGLSDVQRVIREVDPPKPSARLASLAVETPVARRSASAPIDPRTMTLGSSDLAHRVGVTSFKPGETLVTVADRRGTDPRSLRRRIQGDLDWIVMKCLEKDRTRRYETANALAEELHRFLNDEPVTAGPPSRVYRLNKFIRRNKGPVTAAAVIGVALTSGLVGTTFMYSRARAAEERERSERIRAEDGEAHAEKARSEADGARDEAEQVKWFLIDMLSAIEPGKQGKDVKLHEVLDGAAGRIGEKLAEKPLVNAVLQHTMGLAYRGLGLLEQAERHFAESAALYTGALGPSHPRTLVVVNDLTVAIQERGGGLGKVEAAHRSALEIQLRVHGEEHIETLMSMNNLAVNLNRQGRFSEAEQLHRKTRELRRRVLGERHPETLVSLDGVAQAVWNQGRYDEAVMLLREVLAIREEVRGPEHPETLSAGCNLAVCIRLQGRPVEAEALQRKTFESQRRILGPEHPHTLYAMNDLAYCLLDLARRDEAEALARQVLEIRRRVLIRDSPETVTSMQLLATVLLDQGRLDQSEQVWHETVDAFQRTLGPEHPATLSANEGLASAYARQGHGESAEALLREVAEISRRERGPEHPLTLRATHSLAGVLFQCERFDESERLFRTTLEARRRVLGASSPDVAESLTGLATLLAQSNRWDEADQACREAVAIVADRLPPDHRSQRLRASLRGAILVGLGRMTEAEPLLLESFHALRNDPTLTPAERRQIVDRVIRLYEAWDVQAPDRGYAGRAAEFRSIRDRLDAVPTGSHASGDDAG